MRQHRVATSAIRTHLLTGSRTNRSSLHESRAFMPITARKTRNKKKLTTKPDLHQRYCRAGQAGSLAGISKLWMALGRRPASRAIGKALADQESYTLHRPVRYCFPQQQTIVSGPENSYSSTWWTAASTERPRTAPGISSAA